MTASQDTDDLVALEQTRARLETALSKDENWRALRRPGAPGEDSAARRARDTRLEMALADNRAYLAWKHVNEAILALRPRGEGVAVKHPARPGPAPAVPAKAPDAIASLARGDADALELPREIVDLIRAGAQDKAVAPQYQPQAQPQQAAPSLTAAIARVRVAIPPVTAPPSESQPPREKPAAAAPAASGSPARTQPTKPARAQAPEVRVPPPADWEEAIVTFVTREARPSLPQSAGSPAEPGMDRKSNLSERLCSTEGELDANAETSAPLSVATEEAEVTILTPEDKEALRQAEERAGTVRRLRKALSGD